MLKNILLTLCSFCLMAGYAQEHLSGIVLDARFNVPLPGALVCVGDATEGVVTDAEGQFNLTLSGSERWLKISCPGYETRNYEVAPGDTSLTIELVGLPIAYDTVIVFDPETYDEQIQVVPVSAYRISSAPAAMMGDAPAANPGQHAPGQLTAGEVNDFSKWVLWNDKSQEELRMHQQTWKISPSNRFSVMIQDQKGIPVTGETVFLVNSTKDTVWSAVTDNTGRAELWAGMFGEQVEDAHTYSIAANYGKKNRDAPKATPFQEGINHITLKRDCNQPNVVDAVFMVDATGSMSDEINYLKRN
ncbi:MAG: carboxypeptidase regulatory-like domain-containing protein [Saprospirales bacterium]|nr:carboxypeptidase regulatory-like domain-containing protein [Saprospirales bacterium]